ncbi:methylation-associated defense system restriction endonuclease subunit S MAD5 [Allochromatium vinosum]|uniref:methylation-associated defense system restriction endonuclease subunit S MAD5 n=1 Tax=Allochromatium vinosum TaxID=1049 RepID=UPI003F6D92B8
MFQCKAVPSKWLENNGRRLDCGPYMSGAVEAKELLKKHRTEPLCDLTTGYNGGIFNGPRFPRIYVEDRAHGVPFLGSTDILHADLSFLSLLSKKQVDANPALVLDEGWSLITCSGTIGRMAYARSDMKGMAGSQHFMRVAPNSKKIKPGYLYAYLSSRFGLPIVVSGTYGAIIQHIEPHHIAGLPVPRLGQVEQQAHDLVQEAANLRTKASEAVADAMRALQQAAGMLGLHDHVSSGVGFGIRTVSSSNLIKRMDAVFHSPFHSDAVAVVSASSVGATTVEKIAESIVEPKRFKRVQVEDEEFGIPMFGTTALMWADPQPSFLIPKKIAVNYELTVDEKTLLIPRSGQISGIIGTVILPYGKIIGGAVSEDAIRIHCKSEIDAGFLFVALRSEFGRRQLKARAYGSSIPHLDVQQIGSVVVPVVDNEAYQEIGELGIRSAKRRGDAIRLEDQARSLVENAIEEAAR